MHDSRPIERGIDDGKGYLRDARSERHRPRSIQFPKLTTSRDVLFAVGSNGCAGSAVGNASTACREVCAGSGRHDGLGGSRAGFIFPFAVPPSYILSPIPNRPARPDRTSHGCSIRRSRVQAQSSRYHRPPDEVILTTDTLKIEFSLKWGNVQYSTPAGEALLRERNSIPRTYEPVELNGEKTFHVEDRFAPDFSEGFYGLGQHQSGLFNYRGATVELGQNNTDVAIPLLLSSKGYALMWNTASLTYVDNRFPLELNLRSLAGHSVDYYFIYGPEMDQMIHEYRNLTGHTPMLPLWAYGFFQSKDRYVSQDEVLGIAKRYREEHIPLDAIVQDWFWWKAEGDPVFNSNFPDVPGELKQLHDEHIHAMLSVWGMFDTKSQNYQELAAKHFDVPNAHVYDSTNPPARDFYWNNLVEQTVFAGLGCVLARQRRTRRILAPHGRCDSQQQADCDWQRSRVHERIPVHAYPWNPAALASDNGPEASLSSDTFCVLRPAASWCDGVVGRRLWFVLGFAPSSSRRTEFRAVRLSVLDN